MFCFTQRPDEDAAKHIKLVNDVNVGLGIQLLIAKNLFFLASFLDDFTSSVVWHHPSDFAKGITK